MRLKTACKHNNLLRDLVRNITTLAIIYTVTVLISAFRFRFTRKFYFIS
jgi:hypothetical protein